MKKRQWEHVNCRLKESRFEDGRDGQKKPTRPTTRTRPGHRAPRQGSLVFDTLDLRTRGGQVGWGPKAWPSTSYGYLAPSRDSIPIVQERTLGTWHDRDINKAATRERVMHINAQLDALLMATPMPNGTTVR